MPIAVAASSWVSRRSWRHQWRRLWRRWRLIRCRTRRCLGRCESSRRHPTNRPTSWRTAVQSCRPAWVLSGPIIRPHRLHAVAAVHRCGLLLQMSHVVWSASVCLTVCLSVCWAHRWAVQKRLNRSRCRFGWGKGWLVDPRNYHVLDGDQDRTNAFAHAIGDKTAMRPFTKLL